MLLRNDKSFYLFIATSIYRSALSGTFIKNI